MLSTFFSLRKVKQQLAARTLPNFQAFLYFLVIIAIDNLQLAYLQIVPARPTSWTAYSVIASLVLGVLFLAATWHLNGGSSGKDYLVRYFSLSAIVAMWIAIPTQLVVSLSNSMDFLTRLSWLNPLIIFCINAGYFCFVAWQIHQVAEDGAEL